MRRLTPEERAIYVRELDDLTARATYLLEQLHEQVHRLAFRLDKLTERRSALDAPHELQEASR